MTTSTKIDFRHRRMRQLDDVTDLVAILFPGNRNQQHAAARILIELKAADDLVPNMAYIERKHDISRRTLQRTRAKLARLGLIERISWMNTRYGGREGWRLSTRFTAGLRRLADFSDEWAERREHEKVLRDDALANLLGNSRYGIQSTAAPHPEGR